ncbi:DNA primase [Streptomyces sp. NPDC052107]|uniref:DNA primase n=1 Tax=Streptomyces sp. NPDC052107 TaxID=3155632 RepID=UPI00342033DD
MNRTVLGLAVGAGYFLGRTKKLKMALAVGSLVAGKKLNLSPKMLADVVNQQLKNNPQFKEIGDQLRQDLRGVGKAASGAMVERQMNALADRLHGRTSQVRDELTGAVPGTGSDESDEEEPRDEADGDGDSREERPRRGDGGKADRRGEARRKKAVKKAPAKKAADPAPSRKGPAKKAAAKKTTAARKTAAKKTAAGGGAARGASPRQSKGGDER